MAIIYGLKVNLSVAIVAMVNHSAINACTKDDNTTNNAFQDVMLEDGQFNWTSTEQGAVLGSYFVGYFMTQVSNQRLDSGTIL